MASSAYDCIMSQDWEAARERGLIDSYSIYESIGIAVQSAMFRRRLRNKDLAVALGVTPSVAGKKLRGAIAWSVQDVFAAAQMLGVDPGRLLPRQKTNDPGQISLAGIPDVVAGTGFEPVASGLTFAAWSWAETPGSDGHWAEVPSTMSHGHQIQPQTHPSQLGARRRMGPLAQSPRTPSRNHPSQTAAPHAVCSR